MTLKTIADKALLRLGYVNKSAAVKPTNPAFWDIFNGMGDNTGKLVAPYKQHPVVFAAIRSKARNISGVPFQIFPLNSDREITSGPIVALFNAPNPNLSRFQLWEAIITCMDTEGEGFIFLDQETRRAGLPANLFPGHPTTVTEARREGMFVGWNWRRNRQTEFYAFDQAIHFKYYNPYNEVRGFCPLAPLEATLQADYNAIKFNAKFFENDTVPGSVYSTDKDLTDLQYQRLRSQLIDKARGVDRAHLAILLDGGLKLATSRPSNKDMEYSEGQKSTLEKVAMVLGVPKAELAHLEDVNYATALSQDIGYWKKTLIPLGTSIQEKLNAGFLNRFGFRGAFNFQAVDAINADVLMKVETGERLYKMGVPVSIINERLGLGLPEFPGWDERPRALPLPADPPVPAKTAKALALADMRAPAVDVIEAMRMKAWRGVINRIVPQVGKCSRDVREYFFKAKQKLIRRLTKALTAGEKKDLDPDFDITELSAEALKAIIETHIRASMKAGALSVGIDAARIADAMDVSLSKRVNRVVGINDTVKEQLREALRDAAADAATEQERAQAVIDAVGRVLENAEGRAKTIARTEVHGAYSEGRWLSMRESGANKKQWISARDKDVREEHDSAGVDGEIVAFDEQFSNGLQYPLEEGGPAEEVINCRCIMVPIYEE